MHDPIEECMQELNEASEAQKDASLRYALGLADAEDVVAATAKVNALSARYNALIIAYGRDE
jgi:hypothetical protein